MIDTWQLHIRPIPAAPRDKVHLATTLDKNQLIEEVEKIAPDVAKAMSIRLRRYGGIYTGGYTEHLVVELVHLPTERPVPLELDRARLLEIIRDAKGVS